MKFIPTKLSGPFLIEYQNFVDNRGQLARFWDEEEFTSAGINVQWQQQLISVAKAANTMRGLHAQRQPFSEAKLISPLSGRMFWVFIDLRQGSDTFAKWEGVEVSPDQGRALYVPEGFAHGCLSLENGTSLVILTNNKYSFDHGIAIHWNDPDIGIEWPVVDGFPLVISDAHDQAPAFYELGANFTGL
jgi:dTDP-4-dehydrorhamnose 3,5-epimerase